MTSTNRNLTLLAVLASNLAGLSVLAQSRAARAKGSWVYVGTRGAPLKPDAPASEVEEYNKSPQGIYAMQLDAQTGKLTPTSQSVPVPTPDTVVFIAK